MNKPEPVYAIKATGLRKAYLSNEVLRGFSISVRAGLTYGCAGVNGAGKSTFLKCLLDFCHYATGSLEIFGISSRLRSARARMSFLPERFVPPYYLNGRNFVKIVLSLNNHSYDETEVLAMFQNLDLDREALEKPVRSFSKGMTQKLGLASIFLLRRDLYIFDEPMSGLDPKARALLKKQFKRLKERSASLFFTSHSLFDIEEVCDQMAVLHQGLVAYEGSPRDLASQSSSGSLEEAYLALIQKNI